MENRNLAFKLILFICWPFGALIATLNRLKSTTFYVIYFLFCVLFCWHMNPVHLDRYDDLMGIAGTFMFNVIPTEVLLQQIQDYFTFSPNAPRELYINILCWFVHQFSNNPHVFFAVASIPFLIFQTKSFKLITDDNKFKNGSLLCFLVLFLFMLPRDIITVQNPRFTTALWMSVYAILKFWGEGYRKFKYVFLLCLTPLVHSAFWPFIVICVLGYFAVKMKSLVVVLLYISIPFSFISTDIFSQVVIDSLPLPPAIASWVESFAEISTQQSSGGTGFYWVPIMFKIFEKIIYIVIPFYVLGKIKNVIWSRNQEQLFYFYLFLFAFVNFVQVIPDLGVRFFWLIRIISIYILFKFNFPYNQKYFYIILCCCSWGIFTRYFYGGAVYSSVPLDIFYEPLPFLIYDFWGADTMQGVSIYDRFYELM